MAQPPKFTVKAPIAISAAPQSRRGVRPSLYIELYKELFALRTGLVLPVEVENAKAGLTVGMGLRKLAERDAKRVRRTVSEDGKTHYFAP